MFFYEKYIPLLKSLLDSDRYSHSVGAAETAVRLAEHYGADREKAYAAGLLHDITKNFRDPYHLKILKKYGFDSDPVFMASKGIWHAVTGAYYIRDELGICDDEIFSAVRYHTTGRSGMTLLDKIVYVADAAEPGRNYPEADLIRKTVFENIDKACLENVKYSIESGLKKNRAVYADTLIFYNELVCKGEIS